MKYARLAMASFLLGVGLYGLPDLSRLIPANEVVVKEPSDELKKLVEPVERVVVTMTPEDRAWLRDIYINARRIVSTDGDMKQPSIPNTVVLRKVHITVLEYIWKGMAGNAPKKYPSLKSAIDSVVEGAIGLDPKELDDQTRDSAADVFGAIAWVASGRK